MIDVSQLQSLIANFCDLSDGDVQAAIDSMPLITGMNLGLSPLTEDKSSVIVRCARLTVLTATFTQIQGVVLEDALALDREYVLFQGGVVAGDRQELVIRGSVSLRLQLAYMSLGNVRRIVVDPGARVGVMELLELSHGESGAVVLVVLPGATIGQVTLDDSVTIDSASQSVLSSQGTVIHRM